MLSSLYICTCMYVYECIDEVVILEGVCILECTYVQVCI